MDIYDTPYMRVNKKMLKLIGCWPFADFKEKFIKRITYTVLLGLMLIPHILGIWKDSDNTRLIIEHIAVIFYLFLIFMKILTSMISEKKFEKLYKYIAQNWKNLSDPLEKKILHEYSDRGRKISLAYMVLVVATGVGFNLIPLTPKILDNFVPLNETRRYIFILNGNFLVENRDQYYWEIYAFDIVTVLSSMVIFLAVDTMYAVCIEFCLGLFYIVKVRLRMSPDEIIHYQQKSESPQNDIYYQWLVKTIQLHLNILKFTEVLQNAYSFPFLIIMGANMLYFTVLSVLIFMNLNNPFDGIRYIMLFIGVIIHLFYLSWPGQKLIDYSSDLVGDAYQNEWYSGSAKSKQLLIFFTMRCLEPCSISAGGLYIMNLQNFAVILKTSASYFTVLSSMT